MLPRIVNPAGTRPRFHGHVPAGLDENFEGNYLLMVVTSATRSLVAVVTVTTLVLSGPKGEYSRHLRHEECCQTVVELWRSGGIDTRRLWLFAYEDGGRACLPRVRDDADRRDVLTDDVWLEKRRLITDLYGFGPESWEAQSTPREEGFWCFDSAQAAVKRAAPWEQQS